MTKVRTARFHIEHGPTLLFDTAREYLKDLAGLSLEIPHAKVRFDEREIPLEYLSDFRPERWELLTVEIALRTGRIAYMSLRRELEPKRYLWIVLAFEHVITAWITDSASNRATNPPIVKDGPAWHAAAEGLEPRRTKAMFEWEETYIRRARAHQILVALAALPQRPNGDRLADAARLAITGSTWIEAAAAAGSPARAWMPPPRACCGQWSGAAARRRPPSLSGAPPNLRIWQLSRSSVGCARSRSNSPAERHRAS